MCWLVAEPSECTLTSAQQSGFQPQLQSLHVQLLNFLNLYTYLHRFVLFLWMSNQQFMRHGGKGKIVSFFLRKPNFIRVGCKKFINHDIFPYLFKILERICVCLWCLMLIQFTQNLAPHAVRPSVSYCMLFPFLQAVNLVQRRESVYVTACGLDPSGSCQRFGSVKK